MPVLKNSDKKVGESESSALKTKTKKTFVVKKTVRKKRNVSVMQDDVAKMISIKNHGKSLSRSNRDDQDRMEDLEIQRKLTEVYTDSDGDIPDLTRLETIQRPFWKTTLYTLIVVFAVLFIVSAVGFWFFSKWDANNFTNENIILKIDTPITIVSGQESVYTVLITNKEKVNLYNLELELFYPDSFEYIDAVPKASGERNNKWDFSLLKIGETKTIEIKGKIVGAIKSNQTFRGNLNFKPANLNADFKQEIIVDVIISASVLSLDIEGPERVLANQDAEYILKYENISEEDYTDIQIVVDYPSGYVFNSADPESENEINNIWDIDDLRAGESGEIKIIGNYSAASNNGNRDFIARLQIKIDGDYYPQSEETFVTEVIKDQLSTQLIINGSAEDQPISFGDLLVYTLNYKNTGEEDLEKIIIIANLDSQILDWDTLKDENNGVIGKNSITWNGKHIAKLLKLSAGEEGQINWQIRVRGAASVADENIDKFSVESYTESQAQQTGELSGESIVHSKTIVSSVNSDLGMIVTARYYNEDNIPLGLGPIEPKVGEGSTYNIKMELSNNLHDVNNIRLTAKLPSSVTWADRENHDTGDVIYNAATGEVSWNISTLQKSTDVVTASFNVGIMPGDDDRGRILILLSSINLFATDSDTGANINKQAQAITTAFDDPILGRINGIVQ